ncbi:unnamed protein product [Linum trigynum]|uniref:Uncharacterized protein n=1 Tax=Linum trigynum TaxID=586398 RepID=A0AAV2D634_9ROSI
MIFDIDRERSLPHTVPSFSTPAKIPVNSERATDDKRGFLSPLLLGLAPNRGGWLRELGLLEFVAHTYGEDNDGDPR